MPGAARICQDLPGVARRCQELPGVARICQELPGVARICQDLPGSAMTCQELPGFAKSCQEWPGIAGSCRELPESATARSCQELPGAGRSCLPIFPLFLCLGSRAGVIRYHTILYHTKCNFLASIAWIKDTIIYYTILKDIILHHIRLYCITLCSSTLH